MSRKYNSAIDYVRVYWKWALFKVWHTRHACASRGPFNAIQVNEDSRSWVWSAFAGLKKDYQFTKGVRGNFQILYNLYDDHYNSPYSDRLTVRTGFEFPLKKKRK